MLFMRKFPRIAATERNGSCRNICPCPLQMRKRTMISFDGNLGGIVNAMCTSGYIRSCWWDSTALG